MEEKGVVNILGRINPEKNITNIKRENNRKKFVELGQNCLYQCEFIVFNAYGQRNKYRWISREIYIYIYI